MTQINFPDNSDAAAEASKPAFAPPVPEGSRTEPSGATADPILAMIERAARDPAVDIEKFERLMAMKAKVEADRASLAFAEAFAELGPDLPTIDRAGKIVVFSKADREKAGGVREGDKPQQTTPYATLDDILEALRKPLAEHGFSLRFEYQTMPVGDSYRIATTAVLRHRQGHEERASTPPLVHDATGSKNAVQAVGSAMTYGRRYALMAVLPIVSHAPQDRDDDGAAADRSPIGPDDIAEIEKQLRDTESDRELFLKRIGAESVEAMTMEQYKTALGLFAQKRKKTTGAKP